MPVNFLVDRPVNSTIKCCTSTFRKDQSMLKLINEYLEDMTLPNARKVLQYGRKHPTCFVGLNRAEISIYKAIVANLGKEIR
jgi:hypothetical protein